MRIGRFTTALGLAAGGLLAMTAGSGMAQDSAGPREKCFGVARAGENAGIGLGDDEDRSRVDFQGDAWTWVARGTCQTMTLPEQADGTPRRGAIRPLDRDPA